MGGFLNKEGRQALQKDGGKTYRVHLDGFQILASLAWITAAT